MGNSSEEENRRVYVALGNNDLQDGFKTLEWTLKKWNNSQPISIIVLSKDFVNSTSGNNNKLLLPSTVVGDDQKLEALKKYEKEKIIDQYISFCGQDKVELVEVEKCDEPIHKVMIDLISRHRITKLVMGFSFWNYSSSWKVKKAISGSFHVYTNKPEFCELFIICWGTQFWFREENNTNNKGILIVEDDQAQVLVDGNNNKIRGDHKGGFKDWIGKIFVPTPPNYYTNQRRILSYPSSVMNSLNPPSAQNQWESCARQIEEYFQHLLSLHSDEQRRCVEEQDKGKFQQAELASLKHSDFDLTGAEKIKYLKSRLKEAQKIIQANRFEAKENAVRRAKSERAILLCNRRAEELEAKMKEEVTIRGELSKISDSKTKQLEEIDFEVEEIKTRLSSLTELKTELSNKLQISALAKTKSEAQLESTTRSRFSMARENEELRKQRDVLRRRVEFCKEKDAIGMVAKFVEMSWGVREYNGEEIRLATNGFSERLRLKPGGDWTAVYKGRINHSMVAIKMLDSLKGHDDFLAKVLVMSQIRHPHLVSMVGFCSKLKCLVFEYMHNGSLRDILLRDILYARKTSGKRIRTLGWHDRVRVAAEICSGLGFLHMAKPKPIVHGHLRLSNILLDRNLVAKIAGFGLTGGNNVRSDIRAFGVLLMHLLTGRNWGGLVEAMSMDQAALVRDLDGMAGKWPLNIAEKLADVALRCLSSNRGSNTDFSLAIVLDELNDLRDKAAKLVDRRPDVATIDTSDDDVPSCFLCPIFQEVMRNPHVASDGFSYEQEAIEEWLRMGNETSPMTNLRLSHTLLTPNHTLRTLIQDWHNKRSIPLPL